MRGLRRQHELLGRLRAVEEEPRGRPDVVRRPLASSLRNGPRGEDGHASLDPGGEAHEYGGVLFVNCGSVGKPKDGDPRAGFALLEASDDGVPITIERAGRVRRYRRCS